MAGKKRLFSLYDSADVFWSRVEKTDGCWLWKGRTIRTGYGHFLWTENGKRLGTTAHRVAYILTIGHPEPGLDLDHLCRNRLCVNPLHLEPCTHQENIKRGRSGAFNREKTHCSRGHAYDEANTARGSKGERVCRKCSVMHSQKWKAKQRYASH